MRRPTPCYDPDPARAWMDASEASQSSPLLRYRVPTDQGHHSSRHSDCVSPRALATWPLQKPRQVWNGS